MKLRLNLNIKVLLSLVVLAAIPLALLSVEQTSAGVPGSVIVNEIMYNPVSGDQLDEYLELYNTTGSPIDISGWSFSAGITFTFAPATTIPANGYYLISPNGTHTLDTYGIAITQAYTGALSNGGELLTLVDETLQVIDTIEYDDAPPWPTSPDGGGHSLELKDPNTDNTVAANWGASITAPTPMAQNSWVGVTGLPTITSVTDPNNITDVDVVNITANVADETSVELDYKVNFDADITVTMLDDGLSNDGAASDGVYGASIPAQSAGDLVRFKIRATGIGGEVSSPSIDDSMHYHGYTIQDPSVTSNAPIIQWFISDADYDDMIINHFEDNFYLDCVIVYGNDVYDGSRVRIRGEVSRYEDKKPFKFKLPSGYTIALNGGDSIPIGEFNMLNNSGYRNAGYITTGWWVIEQTGLPVPSDLEMARMQKNGEFWGLYIYADKYEQEWRASTGYSTGELYEDAYYVVTGAPDASRVLAWKGTVNSLDEYEPTKLDYVLDNYDVPKTLNFISSVGLIGGWDQATDSNSLQYFDSNTERWSSLIWDIDGLFDASKSSRVSPYNYRSAGDNNSGWGYDPVYFQPQLKELYKRRLRTLIDRIYQNDQIIDKFNELNTTHQADQDLDEVKWPRAANHTTAAWAISGLENMRDVYKAYLAADPWAIPPSQTDTERQQVYIEDVNYDVDPANEYIKISNNASTAVDISNWHVEGIDYEIPAGSVVPAAGSIYLLKSDVAYKSTHASVLVAGQYGNTLGGGGGQLVLSTDTAMEIDTYDY